MERLQDQLVVIRYGALADLMELARTASERLPQGDPLTMALRGSLAQLPSEILPEP